MRVFCDTNVLVAAALEAHVHHTSAKGVLDRISRRDDIGFISAHSLAETFSVLSRMPTMPKLTPQDALAILEKNIIPHFTLVTLAAADYPNAVRTLSAKGRGGGRIYDLLLITAARKQALDWIYTFNESEWKFLAPDLEQIITRPQTVTIS
jgi:predicted nucleic acid-binding protein